VTIFEDKQLTSLFASKVICNPHIYLLFLSVVFPNTTSLAQFSIFSLKTTLGFNLQVVKSQNLKDDVMHNSLVKSVDDHV
jgi:hypothetical protein